MNPKFRIFLYRVGLLGFKLLYAVILLLTCAFTAVFLTSPVVLAFLVVLNKLGKPLTWLGGDFLNLWLCASGVVFIPLLIYSIIYRIVQKHKYKNAMAEAVEKAKEKEKVKEKK